MRVDPSVSVLEEIDDQGLVAAGAGWGDVLTSLTCFGASWVLGNKGHMCSVTVECQGSCRR
jgi:hypothetical protein